MSEKLKAEEELMNLRMTLKQEEMNRSRQFEERIELLQSARNEIQIKNTKQNAELSDLQSRLSNSEREVLIYNDMMIHYNKEVSPCFRLNSPTIYSLLKHPSISCKFLEY